MSDKDAPLDETSLPVEKLIDGKVKYEHVSPVVVVKTGDRVISALSDTSDPKEEVDLVVCEVSLDGGKTWKETARATGIRPMPPPHYPDMPCCKAGIIVSLNGVAFQGLTRTRVVHKAPLVATVKEMSRADAIASLLLDPMTVEMKRRNEVA